MTNREVLIADDDPFTREAIAALLEAEGWIVRLSCDGLEALRTLKDEVLPSVVLVDLIMPRLGGDLLSHCMKMDPRLAEVPVVLMTAETVPSRLSAVEAVLHKPFEANRLVDTLNSVTRRAARETKARAVAGVR